MSSIAELFGEEISDITKHVKVGISSTPYDICLARGRDHEIQYCGRLGRGQTRNTPPQEGVPDPKDLGK